MDDKVNKSFFVHKYKPKKIDDYLFNKELANKILCFGENGILPNIIFHGPAGCGKHTIVLSFLSKLLSSDGDYNMNIYQRSNYEYNVNYQEKNDISINIIKNNHYFEIDADDYGYNDKKIFFSFISEISNSVDVCHHKYKIIIIKNADKLSQEAQYTLKRIMETNHKSFRIIFIVQNTSLIDKALKSRCVTMRIPGPTKNDLIKIVKHVSNKENIIIKENEIESIIDSCGLNINKLLFILECSFLNNKYELSKDRITIFLNAFIEYIKNTDSSNVNEIRNKIYLLLLHNTDIKELFEIITDSILEDLTDIVTIKKIITASVYYNANCQLGYRDIYHFETYIIYVINILNNNDIKLINDII